MCHCTEYKIHYTCLWTFLQSNHLCGGSICICSPKFILPYHYWSAGRQGLWSWQPGLSDLGAVQQPVWAQGAWVDLQVYEGCCSCWSTPAPSSVSHCACLSRVQFWRQSWNETPFCCNHGGVMRLEVTSINAWFLVILMFSAGRV